MLVGCMQASAPSRSSRISVLVAASETLVREMLVLLLGQQEEVAVVGAVDDGYEVLKRIRSLKPRLAIVEQFLAGLNGADTAMRALDNGLDAHILLICRTQSPRVSAALRAATRGCACTSDSADALVRAVLSVAAGSRYVCPHFAPMTEGELAHGLTDREREVLQLIAEGKTTQEIAWTLGIGTKTAAHHRAKLMEKLNVHNVAGLTRFAIREGLISP